jgi:hypothetical protein
MLLVLQVDQAAPFHSADSIGCKAHTSALRERSDIRVFSCFLDAADSFSRVQKLNQLSNKNFQPKNYPNIFAR